jgi:hypothetical protein
VNHLYYFGSCMLTVVTIWASVKLKLTNFHDKFSRLAKETAGKEQDLDESKKCRQATHPFVYKVLHPCG